MGDETWRLADGSVYTKYNYVSFLYQTPMWGHYGHGGGGRRTGEDPWAVVSVLQRGGLQRGADCRCAEDGGGREGQVAVHVGQ